jgi:hypothetical protein
VAALALGLAVVPRRAGRRELAALAAVILVAIQLPLGHIVEAYMAWFLGLAFVGLFAAYRCGPSLTRS